MSATRETDLECNVVGDAECRHFRLAGLEHLLGFLEDCALDAAVGHGSGHLARPRDHHLRTKWARARPPRLDHRRQRDVLTLPCPQLELAQYLTHSLPINYLRADRVPRPARSLPRSSSACRLWA